MIRYRSWSVLFATASLVLCALLWLQLRQSDAPPSTAGTEAPQVRAVPPRGAVLPARLQNLDSYAAISKRPLFASTRRPVEGAAEPAPVRQRESAAGFVLSGVIIVSPEEKIALLRESKSSFVQRLSEGQEIAGWRVEKILADRVILVSGEKTREIELWSDLPPPTTHEPPRRAGETAPQRDARPPPGTIKLPTPKQSN